LNDVRLRQALFGVVLGGALAVTGCASTGPKPVQEDPAKAAQAAPDAPAEARQTSVEYINVVGDGDRVLIGTTGPVKYTVFKLSDPARLIVDMPGISLENVAPSIAVGNDFLGEINSVSYGEDKDIGRIIIGIREGVDHEVKAGENSILVSLKKSDGEEAASVVKASSETVTEEPIENQAPAEEAQVQAEPEDKPALAVQARDKKPAASATKVTGIESSTEGGNTVIRVLTDGLAGNLTSFTLAKPSRIVVDVWGVANSTGKGAARLKDKYIKGVRIGSYADKARLVFDAGASKLPPHSITAENGAIVITIGPNVVASVSKPPVAAAQPAPEAKSAENVIVAAPAAPALVAAKGIDIEAVDFKKVGDKGRLTINSSSKIEYAVKESKDGMTLAMDLKGAVLPDSLVRTLEASKLATPVATVSSYQDSVSPSSVRILVKLKEKAAYSVQESGNSLVVDFAKAPAVEKDDAAAAKGDGIITDKNVTVPDKSYAGKKVDLDMMDANITDVLRLLAEISNINIIASDEVKGTISLRLKNVPWDQAFEIIMKTKNLDSIQEGNVIRVAPELKIRQEREAKLASKKAEEKLEDLELEFVSINYAIAEDLTKQVKSVLSERGDVTTDKRTNTLVIKDIKKNIVAAKNVVSKLDTPVPQVLIEARIVEASSSFARDLGVQWGIDYRTGGNTHSSLFGSSSQIGSAAADPSQQRAVATGDNVAFPMQKTEFTSDVGVTNYAVNLPATGTAGTLGALGFIFGKMGDPMILDLRLSAGESAGQLKTISRPKITTLDNKEAKIEQGESIPFETTSASGTATTFVDANLSLTVTPHITPDGAVLMTIKASRNSIGTFRTSGGQPSINKKEATTDVLVRNGETTVIGGIVITDRNDTERGIPFLKDIPVLGWLFKSKSLSDSQTELLIFITPKIMDKTVG